MNQNNIIDIIETLKKEYPHAKCSLDFSSPFEMVIAVMLSAQCTDERVNTVTPKLFSKYKTPEQINEMNIEELEKIIYSCGFYKNKAKNIKLFAKTLIENYNSKIPETIEELMELPGIGRKSANVIMLEAFNKPVGIAIDTHAKRIANRIGLSKEKEPIKIEKDLLKIVPTIYLKDVNHLLVFHGRKICKSQKPKCKECPINENCEYFNNNYKGKQ